MGITKAHVRPRLAGVERLVDPIAGIRAAGASRLSGADPDDRRVRRGNGDGSDRQLALTVEDRLERRAAVGRLEDAARPGREIERVEVIPGRRVRHRDRGRSCLHPERPDVPERECLQQFGCEEVLALDFRGARRRRRSPHERSSADTDGRRRENGEDGCKRSRKSHGPSSARESVAGLGQTPIHSFYERIMGCRATKGRGVTFRCPGRQSRRGRPAVPAKIFA